jgi:hypothetical protein
LCWRHFRLAVSARLLAGTAGRVGNSDYKAREHNRFLLGVGLVSRARGQQRLHGVTPTATALYFRQHACVGRPRALQTPGALLDPLSSSLPQGGVPQGGESSRAGKRLTPPRRLAWRLVVLPRLAIIFFSSLLCFISLVYKYSTRTVCCCCTVLHTKVMFLQVPPCSRRVRDVRGEVDTPSGHRMGHHKEVA